MFLVTFLICSSESIKFQVALATDGQKTHAVFNYKNLSGYSLFWDVEMKEPMCANKVFFQKNVSKDRLLYGSNIGIPGRYVFSLTKKDCFKASGLRSYRENIQNSTLQVFERFEHFLPSNIQTEKEGKILFHLKEAVTSNSSPVTMIISRISAQIGNPTYLSRYGAYNPSNTENVTINNLFVLKDTANSSSFQYGQPHFGNVATGTKCQRFFFQERMDSIPSIKISAGVDRIDLNTYVNVWLKEVSTSSFKVCAKEVISFIGNRTLNIFYVAATNKSSLVEESTHFEIKSSTISPSFDGCIKKTLKNEYLSKPYVFISVESIKKDQDSLSFVEEPVLAWISQITAKEITVCARSSNSSESYRVHLIVKGDVSPCNKFPCPTNLECRLTSSMKPYCGCIQNCSRKYVKREFCGSDYNDYQSVCLMNKEHCERFGNNSMHTVSVVKHYGKCQSK